MYYKAQFIPLKPGESDVRHAVGSRAFDMSLSGTYEIHVRRPAARGNISGDSESLLLVAGPVTVEVR
jgi:hypothetical protein